MVAFTAEQWDYSTGSNQCANLNTVNQWRPNSFVRSHYSEASEPRASASLSSVSYLEETTLSFKSNQRLRHRHSSHIIWTCTLQSTQSSNSSGTKTFATVRNWKHRRGSRSYSQNHSVQKWESGSYRKYLWCQTQVLLPFALIQDQRRVGLGQRADGVLLSQFLVVVSSFEGHAKISLFPPVK